MTIRPIGCFIALLLAAAAASCAEPQKPVAFGADEGVTIDDLIRALAQNGYQAAQIDEAAGIVFTEWEDTGFMYGEIDDETATIVRRYVGTLSDGRVQLRADSMRCAPDRFTFDGYRVHGRCEKMDGLVSSHQEDLDELGGRVQASLGAT